MCTHAKQPGQRRVVAGARKSVVARFDRDLETKNGSWFTLGTTVLMFLPLRVVGSSSSSGGGALTSFLALICSSVNLAAAMAKLCRFRFRPRIATGTRALDPWLRPAKERERGGGIGAMNASADSRPIITHMAVVARPGNGERNMASGSVGASLPGHLGSPIK